jgi:hypothetical protein
MEPEYEDVDWLRELADAGAYILHVENRLIGKVVEVFDGVEKVYAGPNKRELHCPVVVLERGHTLVARRGVLVRLEEADAVLFAESQGALAQCVRRIAARAGELKVQTGGGLLILAAVLREQLQQVERLFPEPGAASGSAP